MKSVFGLERCMAMRCTQCPIPAFGGVVVTKLIALSHGKALSGFGRRAGGCVPCLAAVVGALNDLAEPPAGLRNVDPIGIYRRALHVVDLPAGEVGSTDIPLLP